MIFHNIQYVPFEISKLIVIPEKNDNIFKNNPKISIRISNFSTLIHNCSVFLYYLSLVYYISLRWFLEEYIQIYRFYPHEKFNSLFSLPVLINNNLIKNCVFFYYRYFLITIFKEVHKIWKTGSRLADWLFFYGI